MGLFQIMGRLPMIIRYSVNRGDYSHFPAHFGFTEKLFGVEYSYLAVIKKLDQEPFTNIPCMVSLIVFVLFQIKCAECHSPCSGAALRTKRGDSLHQQILAPGAPCRARIFAPGVTGRTVMFKILVQN